MSLFHCISSTSFLCAPEMTWTDCRHRSDLGGVVVMTSDVLFLETSALTGEGVTDVFVRVARLILSKIEDGTLLLSPSLHAGRRIAAAYYATAAATAAAAILLGCLWCLFRSDRPKRNGCGAQGDWRSADEWFVFSPVSRPLLLSSHVSLSFCLCLF